LSTVVVAVLEGEKEKEDLLSRDRHGLPSSLRLAELSIEKEKEERGGKGKKKGPFSYLCNSVRHVVTNFRRTRNNSFDLHSGHRGETEREGRKEGKKEKRKRC